MPRAVVSRLGLRSAPIEDVIERQIVPRMLIADALVRARSPVDSPWEPNADDVAELLRLLAEHDATIAREYVRVLRAKGVTETAIWRRLIAPAVQQLDERAQHANGDAARLKRTEDELRRLVALLEHEQPASPRFEQAARP